MNVFFKDFFNIIVLIFFLQSLPTFIALQPWRPPNICHRSVAERCNRGKINLFHDLVCPLSSHLLTLSMLSKLQLFVTGLSPTAATVAR